MDGLNQSLIRIFLSFVLASMPAQQEYARASRIIGQGASTSHGSSPSPHSPCKHAQLDLLTNEHGERHRKK